MSFWHALLFDSSLIHTKEADPRLFAARWCHSNLAPDEFHCSGAAILFQHRADASRCWQAVARR